MPDLPFKRISVVGLGYIGLPTAAMFASRKIEVVGVDVNQQTVDIINRGQVHIVEPDLDVAVRAAVRDGYLRAVLKPEPAQAFLIAVPTPFKGKDRQPDLAYVRSAAEAIAPVMQAGNLVILESTSPVGATEELASWLAELRPDLAFPQEDGEACDIRIAHCPERVLPGRVMQELITNDRVIGGVTKKCAERAVELYQTFVTGDCVIASGPRAAEMAKLVENSFRDVNIAFANELSVICDDLGINVWELISLANRHPRVNILRPGPGVGGHCIAVDPWFIVASSPASSKLIRAARSVNDEKPEWVLRQIFKAADLVASRNSQERSKIATIACYGISFKPDIDDLRESPSLEIVEKLAKQYNGRVLVVEPNLVDLPDSLKNLRNVHWLSSDDAAAQADLHVFLVAHSSFVGMRPEALRGRILDVAGLFS